MSGQLKEVRERMKSVRSTQQITNAMKMVSAAKLRRSQESIVRLRPYATRLEKMLKNIMSNADASMGTTYSAQRELSKALIVVVTSNRGLCGAFNSNIIKAAVARIDARYADVRAQGGLAILCIGKRGFDYFRKRYKDCTIIKDHVDLFSDLAYGNTSQVAQAVIDSFTHEEYDAIDIAYGRFKNAATQFAELVPYLPVPVHRSKSRARADYIFEPNQESLLKELIPGILKTQFQKCLLDTQASEHGARMTAMNKATENADELLKDLRINYNKARQAAITKELSEIVGGAAALEG